jgi:hypothetical protein
MFYSIKKFTHDQISSKTRAILAISLDNYSEIIKKTSELFCEIKLNGRNEWEYSSDDIDNPFPSIGEVKGMNVFYILLLVLKINTIYSISENIVCLSQYYCVRFTSLGFLTILIHFDEIPDEGDALFFQKRDYILDLSNEKAFETTIKFLELFILLLSGKSCEESINTITTFYESQLKPE